MRNAKFVTFSAVKEETAANQIQAINTFQALLKSSQFKWKGFFIGKENFSIDEHEFISFSKFQRICGIIVQNLFGINLTWLLLYPLFYINNLSKKINKKYKMGVCLCRALPLAFFLLLLRKHFGIDFLIFECHRLDHLNKDYKINYFTRLLLHLIFKAIFSRADGIICLTNPLKELIKKEYDLKGPILVIPDGHNFDRQYATRKTISGDIFNLIYTGLTFNEHGVENLVESLFLVPDGIRLTLVGGTDKEIFFFKRKYSKLVSKAKLDIIGRVPHSKIKNYLWQSDCAILALADNLNSRLFCSCLKMFEYMAFGLPIIAPDFPAIRDILSEENALLIKNVSAKDYAEAIMHLREDKEKRLKISRNSFNSSRNYTYESRAARIEGFLKMIIQR